MIDYPDLITSQHASKPRFRAMVAATTSGFVALQALAAELVHAFDVDHAAGHRLDVAGALVGLDRALRPLSPGTYRPAPLDVTPLPDGEYSALLHGKIAANQWDGTTGGAYAVLRHVLGPASAVFTVDNQDMSMLVCVAGAVPSRAGRAALTGGFLGIKPAAVRVNYVFPSAPGGPLFGLGVNNEFIGGLGRGVWPVRG